MKITKLDIKNFIGIEETSIDPKKMNIIAGKNGKGKTSIIEAIKAAFRGADQSKIRVGENKAEIFLATDELEIKRSITAGGTSVTVTKDGKPLPKPQTFLNGIIGDFSFEPVAFFTMSAKEQTEYLLKAVPVKATIEQLTRWTKGLVKDLSDYEDAHGLEAAASIAAMLYQDRAAANARVKQLEGAAAELKAKIPAGVQKVDPAEYNALMEQVSNAKAAQQHMEDVSRRIEALGTDMAEIEAQIVALTDKLNAKSKEQVRLQDEIVTIEVVDTAPLNAKIQIMQSSLAVTRELERLEDMRTEYKTAAKSAKELDEAVKLLQKDAPAELMETAKMPVDGLAFENGQFTLNTVPIQNLSTSEQARLAVAVTRNLNADYEVKAICLDGFEALDSDTQKAFIKETEKDDFQYFITKVSDLDKVEVTSK